jgi:CMP-N-acetylneuraminic acid synthetase
MVFNYNMIEKPKIYAMIPARIGSTRLKMKNLALLDGKPLIYYAINAARESGVFDRIIINSDSHIFNQIAERYGVDFYHRPNELGSSETKSDQVVANFIENNPCDIVAWVNPIAPLQKSTEIRAIVNYFLEQNLDTLHTVKNEQVHYNFNNKPVNYTYDEIFSKTQDLLPLQAFVYTVMMWCTESFMESYRENGQAIFCGKVGFYSLEKTSSIIIKDDKDFILAENMLNTRHADQKEHRRIEYDVLVEEKNHV